MSEEALALSRHFLAIGNHERALAALDREDLLDDPEAWLIRVVSLGALDRQDEALAAGRAALRRFPEDPLLLGAVGLTHQRAGDLPEAERHLLEALRVTPESAWLIARYAELSALGGQSAKAHRLLDRAAQLDPDGTTVLRARWLVANLDGDDREAHRLADVLAARDPDDADALARVGMERLHAGDVGGAKRALHGAARADIRAVEESPELYEELRYRAHPLMIPLRPVWRFGQVPLFVGAIVVANVLRFTAPPEVTIAFAFAWVTYCVYTWVAPPLVRWMVRRAA